RSDFSYERDACGFLLGRLSGRWPRYQICNSFHAVKSVSLARGIFVPQNISVVVNGVDLQSYNMEYLAKHEPTQILAVGSLLPVKRWERVIRAAVQLKLRGLDVVIR